MSAAMPPAKPRSADHLRLVTPAAATATAARHTAAALRPTAAAAARPLGDGLWHGLGIAAATASAGFATYALVFSTGQVVPSGNFNLFTRSDRAILASAAQHAEPKGRDPAPPPGETADRGGIDFDPTGSVPRAATRDAGAPARARADGPPMPGFTLRDVFDGKALVESRSSLSVVKPGSMLEGAGEVLSIEKHGERWVVLTQNGVIGGGRR